MRIRGSRSPTQIATFLEETTVPVRVACQTPGGLWMVSLWYQPRSPNEIEGDSETGADPVWVLECATASSADIVSFLRDDPAVAFEVSTNRPPTGAFVAAGRRRSTPIRRKRRCGRFSSDISAGQTPDWRGPSCPSDATR